MKSIEIGKRALIESIMAYRNDIVSQNMVFLEDQTGNPPKDTNKKIDEAPEDEDTEVEDSGFDEPDTMLTDDQREKWKARPDSLSGERGLEKIPGLFSTKEVKVGTTIPSLVKKGEAIGDVFGNSSKKRASWKEKDAKKKSPDEMKKGTGLSDLQLMPGYGYPAILHDEEALTYLKLSDQDKEQLGNNEIDSDNWTSGDLTSLSALVKSNSPKYWKATALSDLWVLEVTIRANHDSHEMVPVYEKPDLKSVNNKIPYGFYTHFYTSVEGSEKKIGNETLVKIIPHNRATSQSTLALAFNRLGNTGNIIAAARINEENVILMKIPGQVFKFLMPTN